ncbi:hypothetical protein PIB30_112052, partial [Stylosanthes scabra]|nr:hypothetical protein [Stylosanthes scabra]
MGTGIGTLEIATSIEEAVWDSTSEDGTAGVGAGHGMGTSGGGALCRIGIGGASMEGTSTACSSFNRNCPFLNGKLVPSKITFLVISILPSFVRHFDYTP